MEIVHGKVTDAKVLFGGGPSSTVAVALRTGQGEDRAFKVVISRPDVRLTDGDRVVLKVETPAGTEEVVYCRNETTGQVLVDQVNSQAAHLTYWLLALLFSVGFLIWAWVHFNG